MGTQELRPPRKAADQDQHKGLAALGRICHACERATTIQELRESFRPLVPNLDGAYFLFGMRSGKLVVKPFQVVITTYPTRWQAYYDIFGGTDKDPVVRQALMFKGVFRWDDLYVSEAECNLREMSKACGMGYGVSYSEQWADQSMAILSIAGPTPIAQSHWDQFTTAMTVSLNSMMRAVKRMHISHYATAQIDLTPQEKRAIILLAKGKTAEESAVEMSSTPRTVRYYLDRAVQKLGADSRRQAATKAIELGLVTISEHENFRFSK